MKDGDMITFGQDTVASSQTSLSGTAMLELEAGNCVSLTLKGAGFFGCLGCGGGHIVPYGV